MRKHQRILCMVVVSASTVLTSCAGLGRAGNLEVFEPLEIRFDDEVSRDTTLPPASYPVSLVSLNEDCMVFKVWGRRIRWFTVHLDPDTQQFPLASVGGSITAPVGTHNQGFSINGEYTVNQWGSLCRNPFQGRYDCYRLSKSATFQFRDATDGRVLARFIDDTPGKGWPPRYIRENCRS